MTFICAHTVLINLKRLDFGLPPTLRKLEQMDYVHRLGGDTSWGFFCSEIKSPRGYLYVYASSMPGINASGAPSAMNLSDAMSGMSLNGHNGEVIWVL